MTIEAEIHALCAEPAFQKEIAELLEKLCAIDTSQSSDPEVMREREDRIFRLIEEECKRCAFPGARLERRAIPPTIEGHPSFTIPYYARRGEETEPPRASHVYEKRSNLLFMIDGPGSPRGVGTAFNAHVDIVAPYISPGRAGDYIVGRGSTDDKGNIAAAIAALRIMKRLAEQAEHVQRKADELSDQRQPPKSGRDQRKKT